MDSIDYDAFDDTFDDQHGGGGEDDYFSRSQVSEQQSHRRSQSSGNRDQRNQSGSTTRGSGVDFAARRHQHRRTGSDMSDVAEVSEVPFDVCTAVAVRCIPAQLPGGVVAIAEHSLSFVGVLLPRSR